MPAVLSCCGDDYEWQIFRDWSSCNKYWTWLFAVEAAPRCTRMRLLTEAASCVVCSCARRSVRYVCVAWGTFKLVFSFARDCMGCNEHESTRDHRRVRRKCRVVLRWIGLVVAMLWPSPGSFGEAHAQRAVRARRSGAAAASVCELPNSGVWES
eukprot:6001412-Pleurochrysis_carterae.AAC.1